MAWFALFYFLIDGKKFIGYARELSPLSKKHDDMLLEKFTSMSRAMVKGIFVIGGIQGALGGIAFFIAGIPSAFMWTGVMILMAIIPVLGASFIIFPAAGIMFFLMGFTWQVIFLVCAGFAISFLDNILRPKLVGKDMEMYPFSVLIATICGITFFGIVGFFSGPVIIAIMQSWFGIFVDLRKEQANQNQIEA